MRCILLAAGRGRRLGEAGKRLPKGLWMIGPTRIVDIGIEELHAAGISNISVSVRTTNYEVFCRSLANKVDIRAHEPQADDNPIVTMADSIQSLQVPIPPNEFVLFAGCDGIGREPAVAAIKTAARDAPLKINAVLPFSRNPNRFGMRAILTGGTIQEIGKDLFKGNISIPTLFAIRYRCLSEIGNSYLEHLGFFSRICTGGKAILVQDEVIREFNTLREHEKLVEYHHATTGGRNVEE